MQSKTRRGAPGRCGQNESRKILALPNRRKNRSRERGEVEVLVHSGFEGLKVKSDGKDGGRERISVPWGHGDKRIGEWNSRTLFQFYLERVLGIGETRARRKARLGGNYRL